MDFARLVRKAATDIFGIADDFTQLCEHVARQPGDCVVAWRRFHVVRLLRRSAFTSRRFRDADLRGRDAVYPRVIANGARDERRLFLAVEFLRRSEPPFETMAVCTTEIKDDHDLKNGSERGLVDAVIRRKHPCV